MSIKGLWVYSKECQFLNGSGKEYPWILWFVRISMDFVVRLPMYLDKFYSILVVVDILTKLDHFILVRVDYNAE